MNDAILLYDGECGFCDRTVQYVLKHDRRERIRFAPLQSGFATDKVVKAGLDPQDLSSMVLILSPGASDEKLLVRGRAALTTLHLLGGWREIPALLRFLPRFLLDWGYGIIARNRFRMGGRLESCRIPSQNERSRFIE